MAKRKDYDESALIADFKTGRYSQRDLAKKYKVSNGLVAKLTKGVKGSNEHIVSKIVEANQCLEGLTDEEVSAVLTESERIGKLLGIGNSIAIKALKRIRNEVESVDEKYLKQFVEAADKALILGGAVPRQGAQPKQEEQIDQVRFYLPVNNR